MGARKKGRVKFDFNGRPFVWWIDNVTFLRIASDDKRFVVGNLLIDRLDLLAVHGPEFPQLDDSSRPAWFVMPDLDTSTDFGRRVNDILEICLELGGCIPFVGELPRYAGGG